MQSRLLKHYCIVLLVLLPSLVSSFVPGIGAQPSTTTTTTTTTSCIASNSARQSSSSSSSGGSESTTTSTSVMQFFQYEITITAPSRGCHLITSDVQKVIAKDLSQIKIGLCNLFIQHTSASLTINENADPDVRRDMEVALNKIVPAEWNRDGTFRHTMEGDDDMPGHVKSSLMGPSLNIPIRNGRLALGTWQGIYLNEHRDQGGWGGGHARKIIITLQGQT